MGYCARIIIIIIIIIIIPATDGMFCEEVTFSNFLPSSMFIFRDCFLFA